jgi:hypothetical protein
MTIYFEDTQALEPSPVFSIESKENEVEKVEEEKFSWSIYPSTPQGRLFQEGVEQKLIDSKGNWTRPMETGLPPISGSCWGRINNLLRTVMMIRPRSLKLLPPQKQAAVLTAFYHLEGICSLNHIANPIRYNKEKHLLEYEIPISIYEVFSKVLQHFSSLINLVEFNGGGVPYLLGKGYYQTAVSQLPVTVTSQSKLFNPLEKKPQDYDIRAFLNQATYEDLEVLFQVIVSSLAEKLCYYGGMNDYLKFIIQETAFKNVAHIIGEDKHFTNISLGDASGLQFDLTFAARLANQQLFHCHGLSIDLGSFFGYQGILPTPYGSVEKGWRALFEKLTQTVTVDNVDYPYHQGWYRFLSFICKGSWFPDLSVERSLRKQISEVPGDQLFNGLAYVSSQHTNQTPFSEFCAVLTASSLLTQGYSDENQAKLWSCVSRDRIIGKPWLLKVAYFIQSGFLKVEEVLSILQIGALMQCMLSTKSSVRCQFFECSGGAYISIQLFTNRYILIPFDFKHAMNTLSYLLTHKNERCSALALWSEITNVFLLKAKDDFEELTDIELAHPKEFSEMCDLLGDDTSSEMQFLSTWLNFRGHGTCTGLEGLTLKVTALLTCDLPTYQQDILIRGYTEKLQQERLLKIGANLQGFISAIKKSLPSSKISLGLMEDLLKSSGFMNFPLLCELWVLVKGNLSPKESMTFGWSLYKRAVQLKRSVSIDILYLIGKDSHYCSKQHISCWSKEVYLHVNRVSLNRTLPLTELMVSKLNNHTKRKGRCFQLDQGAFILVLKKLQEENLHRKCCHLLISAVRKKLVYVVNVELQILLVESIASLAASKEERFFDIIDLWQKVNSFKLMNLITNTKHFSSLVTTLVQRSYEEGFDGFGDSLLSNFSTFTNSYLNQIVKKRIDSNIESSTTSEGIENYLTQYSSHLTATQVTIYKMDALIRYYKEHDDKECLHLCIDLLSRNIPKCEFRRFSSYLEALLECLTKQAKKNLVATTLSLLTHPELHWFVAQTNINEWMLQLATNTTSQKSIMEVLDSLLSRVETLNEDQQLRVSYVLTDFLSDFMTFRGFSKLMKKSFLSTLEKKITIVLNVLHKNKKNITLLTCYNNLSRLNNHTILCSHDYRMISASFQEVLDRMEHKELILSTCKCIQQQMLLPPFYSSELYLTTLNYVLIFFSHEKEDHLLVSCFGKVLKLMNKIESEKDKKGLFSILVSVQKVMMFSNRLVRGIALLKLMENCKDFTHEKLLRSLIEAEQILDVIENFKQFHYVLSKLSYLCTEGDQKDSFERRCIHYTQIVGLNIGKLSLDESIMFTKSIIKDNAQWWCVFLTAIPDEYPTQSLNMILSSLYKSMIEGTLKGADSDVEQCIRYILKITEVEPSPFIDQLLVKPVNFSNALSQYSEGDLVPMKKQLVSTLQMYLKKSGSKEKSLDLLIKARTGGLRQLLIDGVSKEISELDYQLIKKFCEQHDSSTYYEACVLVKELLKNPSLSSQLSDLLLDFFFRLQPLEGENEQERDTVVEVNLNLLNIFQPFFSNHPKKCLKACQQLISSGYPQLCDAAARLTVDLLDQISIGEAPSPALKKLLFDVMKHSNTNETEKCLNHQTVEKIFAVESIQKLIFERICKQVNSALQCRQRDALYQTFEDTLRHLTRSPPDSALLVKGISFFWDVAIELYISDKAFPYTLQEIHQKICYLKLSTLFKNPVEKNFVLQLWKYSRGGNNKKLPTVEFFFQITADFLEKLLNIKSVETEVEADVVVFVSECIEKIVQHHYEQRPRFLPIIDQFIDSSIIYTNEALFDFCTRCVQTIYRKGVIHSFFEGDDPTLLRCIYFSEVKDYISSPMPKKERRRILGRMIDHFSRHPNHITLRHGFMLLTSLGEILYSQCPDRLLDLYNKLMVHLPDHLYKDVHYVFYNNKKEGASESTIDLIQRIIGSSPDITIIKQKLSAIGARLDVIPLFESIRQSLMSGDKVQFSQWGKSVQRYSLELIHGFYTVLYDASIVSNVPVDQSFDKYNITWYLCDALIKAIDFHGFDTNFKQYFDYAQELIPQVRFLLNDRRLEDRKGVYDVFENLILKTVEHSSFHTPRVKHQQLLVVHLWIVTLLQSEHPEDNSRGRLLLKKVIELKMYRPDSIFYKKIQQLSIYQS